MKTSWNEIQQVEAYLSGTMQGPDRLVFEAKLITNSTLRMDVVAHKLTVSLIKEHARKRLRAELNELHRSLFSDPTRSAFQQLVFSCFRK